MSRMKHLLRKLHIGADQPHRVPTTRLDPIPNANPNPNPNPSPSSTSPSPASLSSPPNGAITAVESTAGSGSGSGVDFNLLEEEYQMQLAMAISASDQPQSVREDPEKDQIDAAKRISLGCTTAAAIDGFSQTRVELLSLRYWTYNAINYDEKVLDGFYDVYVITSKSVVPGKMPLLADLQALSNPKNVDYEVILVNRSVDTELQLLEDRVSAVYNECGAVELGPVFSGLIQKIADIVVQRMGGQVGDADEMLKKWRLWSLELQNHLNSVVLPLGSLNIGLSRHRALLFKVLADRVNLPCMLVKGSYYTGTDEGAVNFIKIEDGSEYIIDLMGAPGALIPAEVPSNQLSNTGLIVKSFMDVAEIPGYPQLGLEKGIATQADLRPLNILSTDGSSMLGQASFVSMQTQEGGRNFAEKNQTERFECEFGKLLPSLHNSCEHSYGNTTSTSQAENMKINDVSKYVLSASKDPEFAQKLHAVLLESGASPPCNLLSDANLKDLVEQNFPEDLDLQAQWNPENPLVTTSFHLQIANNIGCNHKKNQFIVKSAQKSDKFGIDVPDSNFSSHIKTTTEGPLHVSGLSDEPVNVNVNVKGLDVLPLCLLKNSSRASHEEHIYITSSPFLADSCQRLLESHIVCNGKRQIGGNIQSFASCAGVGKEPSLEVGRKSGTQIGCNEHTEKINQVFSEVAEWEIPWEDLQIGERIGIGSYGEVYRSEWNGTEVAVKKFLDQDFSGDALVQFRTEVEIMLRLRHPNVVLFMGAVTRSPHFSILTEFLPRGSLYKLLHRSNQRLDERRRLRMALDVAKGMNYLHSSHPPIVHRDLKSPNLLVDKSWAVKVCDFGLSRLKHHTFLSSKSTAGTPEWMAPEVLRNEPANEKCDVYSFGVVLWELATMSIPWKGLNPMQVVGAVGFQNRRLEIPENIDPGVSQIINDCWQREPHMRPSFAQIMSRLRRLQHLIVDKPPSRSSLNNESFAQEPTPAP